jgi:hypothetical protein
VATIPRLRDRHGDAETMEVVAIPQTRDRRYTKHSRL